MNDCKYCLDEVCVNADCPMVTEYCPVPNDPDVCKWEERDGGNNKDPIEQAIAHYQYGIDCDIFSEPVATYAQMAIEALTFYKDRELYIKAPMKMTEWLKQELTVHCYNRCMEEL